MASITLPDEIVAQSLCTRIMKLNQSDSDSGSSSDYSDVEETTLTDAIDTVKSWSNAVHGKPETNSSTVKSDKPDKSTTSKSTSKVTTVKLTDAKATAITTPLNITKTTNITIGNTDTTDTTDTTETLSSLITIVITTSPSPLHPSTVHIEKVAESIKTYAPQLSSCRKIIVCDGSLVRDKNKFRSGRVTQDAYDRYVEYKKKIASLFHESSIFKGENYELIELKERHGFGFAVRKAMFHHVQTPIVLIVQHDRTFMRPVDVISIVSTMKKYRSQIGYILLPITSTNSYVNQWFTKFSQSGIKGKEADLRTYKINLVDNYSDSNSKCYSNCNAETKEEKKRVVPHLLPCFRWYDSSHFAFSDFYRDHVFSNQLKLVTKGGFIEDKLGQAQRAYYIQHGVAKGAKFWKMWLYQDDDPNVERMIAHLDGSSGGHSTLEMLNEKRKRAEQFTRGGVTNNQ
jgi:hypothetical protein